MLGDWLIQLDGHYSGLAGLHVAARDMAKFGLLYLNDGEYEGNRTFPAGWVQASLQRDSDPAKSSYGYFRDCAYGYQW
jgi:CubicO group peptidase (beta-lactamase class C family)